MARLDCTKYLSCATASESAEKQCSSERCRPSALLLRRLRSSGTSHPDVRVEQGHPALTYGETDDFGFQAVHNRVHIHDLHATILHQLGLNHERLTYRYAGRDFRLTDVAGKVLHDVIA